MSILSAARRVSSVTTTQPISKVRSVLGSALLASGVQLLLSGPVTKD